MTKEQIIQNFDPSHLEPENIPLEILFEDDEKINEIKIKRNELIVIYFILIS